MSEKFINLSEENIDSEHLCCIIRQKKPHEGVEEKRNWLKDRIKEGHVFRKLDDKATVFIEYALLEKSWVPVIGENFYYIYCLWVLGDYKNKGYGRKLMEYCIEDARKKGKSGICMLGAKKQKSWLSDQDFAKKYGFKAVDETKSGYELLALSFDNTIPRFSENAKREEIEDKSLTIYFSNQCPFIIQTLEKIKKYCEDENIAINLIKIDTLEKAKNMPCVFNNYAVFYKGQFETVNLLDVSALKRILKH